MDSPIQSSSASAVECIDIHVIPVPLDGLLKSERTTWRHWDVNVACRDSFNEFTSELRLQVCIYQ